MRAVRFHEHGGPEVLAVEAVPRPEPGHGEVVVSVAAAGVNPVDTYFRAGSYTPASLPFTPGVDLAGTVEAIGDGVDDLAPGDRVVGTGIGNADRQGSYAEFAAVPVDRIVPLPEEVDVVAAGAAGVVAATAWRALVEHAALRPTEACLVHGGSGGVGHAAVQVAAAAGARVVATACPDYHEAVRDLGADAVLDYGRADLRESVVAASDGGVDVVLDHRLDDYLQFDADVATTGCRVVGIGESDPTVGLTDDGVARSKDVSVQFMSLFNAPDLARILRAVVALMARGDLRIEVARSYDLADAAAAQRAVMGESFLGKLVVVP